MAKEKKKVVKTPLMTQYMDIKAKHPDAILLFRVGDFYETFSDDAIKAAKILGITLTKRANGAASFVELAGFPYHALDNYLPKLVRAGQRVAVCEQLEDPKATKSIVKRGVTELVTPGVSYNDNVLHNNENNFLASVHIHNQMAGLSLLDISTGEFLLTQGSLEYIDKLLNNFTAKEVLYERSQHRNFEDAFGDKHYCFKLDEWAYNHDAAYEKLTKQFDISSLKGFGVEDMQLGITAAGAILHYLDLTHHHEIKHISSLSRIAEERYVWLDKFTMRNLELLQALNTDSKALVDILDKSQTPMGARMLRRWIALPLKDPMAINKRLDVVEYFVKNTSTHEAIIDNIKPIGDIERLISKVAVGRINPREMMHLCNALTAIVPIKELSLQSQEDSLCKIAEQLNPCTSIQTRISNELQTEPPFLIHKGGVIAQGVSDELDEHRYISHSGKDLLLEMQQRETEATGISSLKVSFNNVFGYYFEVRNVHKDKVPPEWTRKQTLVNAERYINQELKDLEHKILSAEEKILGLEQKLFAELVAAVAEFIPAIQLNAVMLAQIDLLLSFATAAMQYKYNKPTVDNSRDIDIKKGRHPVIENQLPIGEEYISNNLQLDPQEQQIIIITGPNMAGKSALLRQTALIVIMAQIGSFVPAQAANIGVIDKVFTRVGASDNIAQGESTFMVEMNEAASILNNVSDRSLILFDELGRGTSTYDGISIAWAIVEYLHEQKTIRPKTLFATHYHELNEMENSFQRIRNYNVSVRELNNKVIFLRKLVAGGIEHSFGIHVARMAGMPKKVLKRADAILKELEKSREKQDIKQKAKQIGKSEQAYQLSFYQLDDPTLLQIKNQISQLDVNQLTPIEALNKLNEIKKLIGTK